LEFLVADNKGSRNYATAAQSHQVCGPAKNRKINPALREWLDLLIPTMVQHYLVTADGLEYGEVISVRESVQ
jgi:hypothetical protein